MIELSILKERKEIIGTNCFSLERDPIDGGIATIQLFDSINVASSFSFVIVSGILDIKFEDKFNTRIFEFLMYSLGISVRADSV